MQLSFGDSLAVCSQAMVGLGSTSEPKRASPRVTFVTVLISGTVIWASYQVILLHLQ